MVDISAQQSVIVATPARKSRQGRSPAFPFIPLGTAIERAEVFRVAEGGRPKHYAPMASLGSAWGASPKTGPFAQTVAALGHFGLFEFEGSGDKRTARLTDGALRILLDKQPISLQRDALIQQAALKPTIHAELWQKWQTELPSSATLETFLILDKGFSESGARDLIGEYKDTLAFAKFDQPANLTPDEAKEEEVGHLTFEKIEVGDLVNVERGGALVFPKPVRVREVQERDGQTWIWTDGAEAWTEMETVELVSKGVGNPVSRTPPPLPIFEEQKTDVRISTAEREWSRGPLSKETSYRLIVAGDLGPKEIGKLIKLLKAQQAVLSDDDDNEAEQE